MVISWNATFVQSKDVTFSRHQPTVLAQIELLTAYGIVDGTARLILSNGHGMYIADIRICGSKSFVYYTSAGGENQLCCSLLQAIFI